jgi:hypothetical protein
LIIPPTVVQREDYSDIEKRVTNYEKHMQDLDKAEMFKAIREQRQIREQRHIREQQQIKREIENNSKSHLKGLFK